MIRLNITAEGFSEERFATDILRPHLLQFNVYVEVRKTLTNKKLGKRGGVAGYQKFRNDLIQWFRECPDVYHTTLIDLYGLSTDFPGHQSTKASATIYKNRRNGKINGRRFAIQEVHSIHSTSRIRSTDVCRYRDSGELVEPLQRDRSGLFFKNKECCARGQSRTYQ